MVRNTLYLAVALCTAPSSICQAQDASSRVQTAEEATLADARVAAQLHGVNVDEAARRLRLEEGVADAVGQLRETYRDRFAGLFIQHKPDYHVVLRLKGEAPAEPITLGSGASSVRVDVVTGASATLRELQSSVSANMAGLAKLFPTMIGVGPDERTGEIVVDVQATPLQAAAVQGQLGAASTLLGYPVRLRTYDGKLSKHAVRGGSNLQSACTSGFVVKNGTQKGTLTAGHCPSTLEYSDAVDGTYYTLSRPVGAVRDDASHDVQFLDATADALPQFYADSTTPRVLTGKRLQSSTTVGSTVCHRGDYSKHSCGSVESISYTPTKPATTTSPNPYYCGPSDNLTCSATWVQVGGSTVRCQGGDSGGPWFIAQTALGVHTGGFIANTGSCLFAWYMSTDRITGMGSGYALLFGP